jgi:hypothetical protein
MNDAKLRGLGWVSHLRERVSCAGSAGQEARRENTEKARHLRQQEIQRLLKLSRLGEGV